jgi:hypothetical protein
LWSRQTGQKPIINSTETPDKPQQITHIETREEFQKGYIKRALVFVKKIFGKWVFTACHILPQKMWRNGCTTKERART